MSIGYGSRAGDLAARITFRISAEDLATFRDLCTAHGCTISGALRQIIQAVNDPPTHGDHQAGRVHPIISRLFYGAMRRPPIIWDPQPGAGRIR